MNKPNASFAAVLLSLAALVALASPGSASAAPTAVWKLSATSQPTNLIAGSNGEGRYLLVATNVGAATATGEEITITDTLPAGLSAVGPVANSKDPASAKFSCTTLLQTVTCKGAGPVHAGTTIWADIPLNVTAPEGLLLKNEAEVSGGGALPAKASNQTTVSSQKPPFDFLAGEEGFRAPIIGEEGAPIVGAGSHPYESIVDLNFPTVQPGGFLTSAGHLRDATIELPPGMLANPAAAPTRCTEAELVSEGSPGCPDSSQVGTISITTFVLGLLPETAGLYNMVPPPGAPAAFGFDALGVGIFPHVVASIRTESDYGASGTSSDILARGLNPILNASVELWGDPSSKAHDFVRGECLSEATPPCEAEAQPNAFLNLPVDCAEEPLFYRALADSWEEPFPEFEEREAQYESADLEGNPVAVEGCNQLQFNPSITARPTTSVTESPSGLDVDLHQPQDTRLGSLATAELKDAVLTLPKGLEINASQADGLAACDSNQIGTITPVGESPASFSAEPARCPEASKLGTVEVTSPLLAQYDAEDKVQRDPEGNPIPEALHGSVFIAKPFDNPFKSLLAIYLTVEDPKTGTFAKLAGEVQADPITGQLSTSFEENPELPLEDAKVHLFTGSKAPLQTPGTCASFTTTTEFVPWSAPDTPSANPSDSFATTAAPGGGSCPATAAQAPNSPAFSAGTENPKAGTYSPLIAKLSRADGTQRMAKLETTFPPGLSGKLAGIAQCSEAQIAAAAARSHPNEGALELASPSCPAASEVGITNVAAGAGPTPFHIGGHLYLAGPYKGAPLSFVAITPAVAGPFDLGSVVVRIAAYLDPVSAQVRAVSDPFPQILQGIPVDVRSVAVRASRPNFTLNPTSCEPKSFTGSLTSILGSVAPLSDTFQVGGCASLPYKPKLTARLFGPIHRGGHPRFRSVFTARPGDANTGRIVFALPSSEFIDQGHFRTICTRVQFAANQCPAGSIYGHVKATSPLVDYPVEGPIYLRSSSHELPDVVAALRGPANQPIAVDLDGRVDSVNGGIRTTFETVPDLPVTKAIVTLQGAKKGLFQNSTNICKGVHRASAKLSAQSGKVITLHPKMQADCPKPNKKGRAQR
jgi:uncharacterized repeat protein (TIGR01451 family)